MKQIESEFRDIAVNRGYSCDYDGGVLSLYKRGWFNRKTDVFKLSIHNGKIRARVHIRQNEFDIRSMSDEFCEKRCMYNLIIDWYY